MKRLQCSHFHVGSSSVTQQPPRTSVPSASCRSMSENAGYPQTILATGLWRHRGQKLGRRVRTIRSEAFTLFTFAPSIGRYVIPRINRRPLLALARGGRADRAQQRGRPPARVRRVDRVVDAEAGGVVQRLRRLVRPRHPPVRPPMICGHASLRLACTYSGSVPSVRIARYRS